MRRWLGRFYRFFAEKSGFSSWMRGRRIRSLVNGNKRILRQWVHQCTYELNGRIGPKQIEKRRYLAIHESDNKYFWLQLEIQSHQDRVELFLVNRKIFSEVFLFLLGDYKSTKNPNTVEEYFKEIYRPGRTMFRDYCTRVVEIFKQDFQVDLFILPKLHDDWIIDFIQGVQTWEIPIAVNERETVNTPKRMEVAPSVYRDYVGLRVDKLCLANPTHYKFWQKAGFPHHLMSLIGDIKSDYWHHPELWKDLKSTDTRLLEHKKKILVFAFGKNTYRNYYYPDDPRDWTELNRQFHQVLLWAVQNFSNEVQIVYKTGAKAARDLFDDYDRFIKETERLGGDSVFLRLDQHSSALDLVRNCDAVIGFQTTGLIEAMFTDRPIVSVGWGELFDDSKETLLPLYKTPALTFADSPERLKSILRDLAKGKLQKADSPMLDARKQFRETIYFQPDGKASRRYLDEIDKIFRPAEVGFNQSPRFEKAIQS